MRIRSRARKVPFVLAAALVAAVATGLLLQAADASAQSPQAFPSKPLRFLISFTPGGTTDTLARTLAERMAKAWGQPVLPENRPGAAGVIAAEMTARAPADGHTLLMASSGYAINATLQPKLPYDSVKDITGVGIVADLPNIVIVHPSLPVRTIGDLLALARKRPGQLSYASAGTGSSQHLAGELFKSMTGTNIVHVPYKGGVPATTDLIGGHVDLTFGSTANLPGVRAGRLRAIAVTTSKRSPALPDLPTVDESGVPGYEAPVWYAVLSAAGTPREALDRLSGEIRRFTEDPAERARFREQTADLRWASPDDTTAFVHAEIRRWGEVVRRSGARTN
ncbi:MAG: tripartite tricarboxylate transporter substrate binding protein [Pseudomonadota bacterium]